VAAGTTSVGVTGTHFLTLNNRSLTAKALDFASMALSPDDVLAYRVVGDQSRLTWYDRQGRTLGSVRELGDYQHPWLSPDDSYVVVEKTDPTSGRHTLWKVDVARDITSKLLDDPTGAHGPVWSPDGNQIAFLSNRFRGVDVFVMRPDGGGTQTPLLVSPKRELYRVSDWSRWPDPALLD
jgi:Tol biopolymer transport system component